MQLLRLKVCRKLEGGKHLEPKFDSLVGAIKKKKVARDRRYKISPPVEPHEPIIVQIKKQ